MKLKGKMVFAFLLLTACTFAEDFRVHKTNLLGAETEGKNQSVSVGINDSVILALPQDMTFVQGLEITIKVPKIVTEWRDSVAWSLYEDISPVPSEKRIDYSEKRVFVGTFANRLSQIIKIPLSEDSDIKEDAYSQFIKISDAQKQGFIFLRFQLAMKGAGDELTNAKISVSAKPILKNKGRLVIQAEPPEGTELKPFTTFVDGTNVNPEGGILLDTGSHDVSIVSDFYRNELRTVTIEKAKTENLHILFRDITPMIRLFVPQGSLVFIDETPVENYEMLIPTVPGDHTIKIVVGNYEIVKTLKAANGINYNVSVSMDAVVSEEE